jgi:hypothetical protein
VPSLDFGLHIADLIKEMVVVGGNGSLEVKLAVYTIGSVPLKVWIENRKVRERGLNFQQGIMHIIVIRIMTLSTASNT